MPRRSAFTLLELLLTLAVLAAIAAVVVPQLGGLLSDRRLVRAAEQVRVEMVRLRVDAMRAGRVMMLEGKLQQAPGSLRKRPYHSLSDATESTDLPAAPSALVTGAEQGAVMPVDEPDESAEKTVELPEGVVVSGVSVVSAARAAEIMQNTAAEQAAGWSQPVLFYPDGTTSTATISLQDPELGTIRVKLRGINGDVTIGEIEFGETTGGGGAS